MSHGWYVVGHVVALTNLTPRQPRYFLPGFPQHVIQRGVDRQAVFFHADDYELYRLALSDAAEQCNCKVHAYVLMTNHTHLLITPESQRSLPRLMQAIAPEQLANLRDTTNACRVLRNDRFKDQIEVMLGRSVRPGRDGRPRKSGA